MTKLQLIFKMAGIKLEGEDVNARLRAIAQMYMPTLSNSEVTEVLAAARDLRNAAILIARDVCGAP